MAKNNRCFELLEASAEQARISIREIIAFIQTPAGQRSSDAFEKCRKEHKRITRELTEHLCATFVTPIEREDIAVISSALNRVSKAGEKFLQRFELAPQHLTGWNLIEQASLLQQCADLVAGIVIEICREARLDEVRKANAQLQKIETDADRLLELSLQKFYSEDHDSVRWVVQKDLAEQLEKVFDRCRSVGNISYWSLIRNT